MARARRNQPDGAIVVTMRDLSRKTGEILGWVMDKQRPVIIKSRSGFAGILQPVDQERINQLVLEHVSDLIATRESSEQALAEGRTMTASALAEELGVDLAARKVRREATREASTRYYKAQRNMSTAYARRITSKPAKASTDAAVTAATLKGRAAQAAHRKAPQTSQEKPKQGI